MWLPALNRPMNDIKTIEEGCNTNDRRRVVTALKRLDERLQDRKRKVTQSGTNSSPQFTAPPPLCGGRTLKTMVNGELYWGVGRQIAALLRGDLTLKVWSVMDNRGV